MKENEAEAGGPDRPCAGENARRRRGDSAVILCPPPAPHARLGNPCRRKAAPGKGTVCWVAAIWTATVVGELQGLRGVWEKQRERTTKNEKSLKMI